MWCVANRYTYFTEEKERDRTRNEINKFGSFYRVSVMKESKKLFGFPINFCCFLFLIKLAFHMFITSTQHMCFIFKSNVCVLCCVGNIEADGRTEQWLLYYYFPTFVGYCREKWFTFTFEGTYA